MIILTPNAVAVNVSTTLTPVSNATTIMLTNVNGRESLIRTFNAGPSVVEVGSFFLAPNAMVTLIKGADHKINAAPTVAATVVKIRM
jgi:hypothetical protein